MSTLISMQLKTPSTRIEFEGKKVAFTLPNKLQRVSVSNRFFFPTHETNDKRFMATRTSNSSC